MSMKVIVFLGLYMILGNGIAQTNTFKIKGKIVDEKNIPLEFVSVYINSTSIFTSTDSLGRFTMTVPSSKIDFELVVSLVGFLVQKQKFNHQTLPKFLSIKLKSNNLGEVVIKARQDRFWKRKWQIFKSGLLGENGFSRNCTIEDKENIHLSLDENEKFVLANSAQPFVVINKALGYKIHVDLYQFSSDGKNINYSASKYFEEDLDKEGEAKQLRNRKKAFAATPNFFLHSLAKSTLEETNFEVFQIKDMLDNYLGKTTVAQQIAEGRLLKVQLSDFYKYDSLTNTNIIFSELPLLVFNKNEYNYYKNPFSDYSYMFSKIILPNFFAKFNDSGFLTVPNGITFYYQWGNEGLASSLPVNYVVDENLPINRIGPTPTLTMDLIGSDSLMVDKISHSDQSVGFQKSLNDIPKSQEDNFIKSDYSFRPSELEKNLDIYTLLRKLPGLQINQNLETGEVNITLSGMNTNHSQNKEQDNTPALLINKMVCSGKRDVTTALDNIETSKIIEIGVLKYGSGLISGSSSASGTIIIKMNY